jgi:ribonucleotide reductase beta subunit family protein with ferritin-like domain/glutaredoxin
MITSNSKLFQASAVYKPFSYPWAVDVTREHEKMHWIEDEVPLGDDLTDWKMGKLSATEKEFVTQILRMFTQSDVNVGGYYYDNLIPILQNNEVRNMLGSFAVREGTHQRAYALLNDTLGLAEGDYAAFLDYAEMREKHEYMLEADPSTLNGLALALVKGVFNEGVSLFASFVMLLNFQRPEGGGRMKGMSKIVEWSIKDETKHVEGVARLFRTLCNEHPEIVTDAFKRAIYDIAREVVRLEDAFVDLAYKAVGGAMPGLTAAEVKQYIRYVADRRLVQLGLKPNFEVASNPLAWLDWVISAADHTNFFEQKVAEYEVGGLQGEWGYGEAPTPYTVYGRAGCSYCVEAKLLLESLGIEFVYHDLTDDAARQAFYDQHGFTGDARRVPKIWVRDTNGQSRHLGGYTELAQHLERR